MRIGIISDSHDSHANVLKAVKVFNEQKVDYVLHAGDIISPFTVQAFSQVKGVKFIAVYGNNDGEKLALKNAVTSFGGEIYEYCYKGQIGGKRIIMMHVPSMLDEIIASGKYDIVIYGHTHKQDIRQVGNTLVINPGESTDWITGSSDVIILETDNLNYDIIAL